MADRLVTSYPDGHELRLFRSVPPYYLARWQVRHPVGCVATRQKHTTHQTEAAALVQLVKCQVEPCEVGR